MKCEYCNMVVKGTGNCEYCGAPIPEIVSQSPFGDNDMFKGNQFFSNFNMEPGKNTNVTYETHTYTKNGEAGDFDMNKFQETMRNAFQSGNVNKTVKTNKSVQVNNEDIDAGEILDLVDGFLDNFSDK